MAVGKTPLGRNPQVATQNGVVDAGAGLGRKDLLGHLDRIQEGNVHPLAQADVRAREKQSRQRDPRYLCVRRGTIVPVLVDDEAVKQVVRRPHGEKGQDDFTRVGKVRGAVGKVLLKQRFALADLASVVDCTNGDLHSAIVIAGSLRNKPRVLTKSA